MTGCLDMLTASLAGGFDLSLCNQQLLIVGYAAFRTKHRLSTPYIYRDLYILFQLCQFLVDCFLQLLSKIL